MASLPPLADLDVVIQQKPKKAPKRRRFSGFLFPALIIATLSTGGLAAGIAGGFLLKSTGLNTVFTGGESVPDHAPPALSSRQIMANASIEISEILISSLMNPNLERLERRQLVSDLQAQFDQQLLWLSRSKNLNGWNPHFAYKRTSSTLIELLSANEGTRPSHLRSALQEWRGVLDRARISAEHI